MGRKPLFRLFNIHLGEDIGIITMDENLIDPAQGIVDPETGTLKGFKNANNYTLIPVKDHRLAAIETIGEVYKNLTEKPAKMFSTHTHRVDELIMAIDLMYKTVKYVLIENMHDLDVYINKNDYKDVEDKIINYSVYDDIITTLSNPR